MESVQLKERRVEGAALMFLLFFLGSNAFFNAFFGFSLLFFLGAVPLSAALAFFFPRSGLAAVLLLTIFFERFFTLQPLWIGDASYKLYPLDVILVAVLAGTFLHLLSKREHRPRFRFSDVWLLSFFAFVSVIFLVSAFGLSETSGAVAFSTWKNYVFYGLVVFALGVLLRKREDFFEFARLLLWGVMAASVFLLVGIVRGGGLWTEYTPLSTAGVRLLAFPHAFYFSLALLALLLSLPSWWGQVSRRRRGILTLFMTFLLFGIIGSLMRHLWLGLMGAVAVALFLSPSFFGRTLTLFLARFIFPVSLLLAGAWYFFALFPESGPVQKFQANTQIVTERLLSIGDSYDESLTWRSEVWESALARFWDRPVFGIGFGVSVPVEFGDYREYVEVRNMHNSWLALLIQTGIVGCLLLAGALLSLLIAMAKRNVSDPAWRQARFVLVCLLAFEALVFFSQPYLETNLLGLFFWVTLGFMRSFVEIPERPTSNGRLPAAKDIESQTVYTSS